MEKIRKKLVNDPKNSVADALHGYVLSHSNVKLLQGYHAIVRSDLQSFKHEGKVCTITGGGSGHEPFAIGYVGKGLLTASVAGDIFAAPSTANILATLENCYTDAGALFIVTNYTGDRLAFGKALEMANASGKRVDMVVVGEDCALVSKDKSAGRRGLCGTVLIHKIAGAMAEDGKTLDHIVSFLRETANEMCTISISLSACSVPGKPPGFSIPQGMLEFGLGIHGEAGISQIEMRSAEAITSQMIEHITTSRFLPKLIGHEVAIVINNLGGTSNLELSIMAKEALACLHLKNVIVKRCYVGAFVTSLEMAGVSITVMLLNDERQKYLDAFCECSVWPKSGEINDAHDIFMQSTHQTNKVIDFDEKVSGKEGLFFFACIKEICCVLMSNEDLLNRLDRACGDGDTGTTFAKCASVIAANCADEEHVTLPINNTQECVLHLAKEIETNMGGSSGALLSLLLTAASHAVCDNQNKLSFFSEALKLGIEAVKRYGGAEEGDRTMIDALQPALQVLHNISNSQNETGIALEKVAQAARSGADATINMKASAGRASYVSNQRLVEPDPGAVAVALIFETIYKVYMETMI